jgi:hypothetical protein
MALIVLGTLTLSLLIIVGFCSLQSAERYPGRIDVLVTNVIMPQNAANQRF